MSAERDPRNAPGDFFVEAGMCILCGAPELEAPELMRTTQEGCYFARQPQTAAETEQAINAIQVSCCEAVQYGGSDPEILKRVRERT